MRFVDLIHTLGGYVTIQGDGPFPERFLNLCAHRDLEIWNIRYCGAQRFTAQMELSSFFRLRPICRCTQTHVRVLKRRGLPFLFHRYRHRRFALLGLFLVLFLLWYTSGHIMGITVFGNQRIDTATILDHLARIDIALGKPTATIDADHIRNHLMQDLDDLAWLGVNVNGSRVYIEIVERLEEEPVLDQSQPCHLVAAKDGVIVSVEARNGQTMVTPNSGVCAGDILVSGIMDNAAFGFRYVHAYGSVYATTRYSQTQEYPLTYQSHTETGQRKQRHTLQLLGRQLPLFFQKDPPYALCRTETTQREFRLPLDSLPSLFLTTETYIEEIATPVTRTVQETLALAQTELEAALREQIPPSAEVLDCEVDHTLTHQGGLSVTVTLVCREDIAKKLPLTPEEQNQNFEEN